MSIEILFIVQCGPADRDKPNDLRKGGEQLKACVLLDLLFVTKNTKYFFMWTRGQGPIHEIKR